MAAPSSQGPASTQVNEDTLIALTGFSIADPDSPTLTTVIVKVSHGKLQLDPVLGAVALISPDQRKIEFFGKSPAEINAALATLKYLPDANYNGPDSVLFVLQDENTSSTVLNRYAIDVRPVNDAPVITSNGGSSSNFMSIVEGSTDITKVVASDVDGDKITYKIAGGEDADKVKIDSKTGKLTFINPPDYSNPKDANGDDIYRFTVEATDGKASDKQTFFVAVDKDFVNVAPEITSDGGGATAAISVAEGTTAVTQVLAHDQNAGTKLKFFIAGGADAGQFEIDGKTGALTFLAAPNFDAPTDAGQDNVYDVVVSVSDGKLVDTQAIAVTVTDVERPPVILSEGGADSAIIHRQEGALAVTTVIATDPDLGDTITYSILGGDDAALFTIDPNTGQVSFINAPVHDSPTDANGDNVYQLVVGASDGQNLDVQSLTIDIDDAAGVLIIGTTGRDKVNGNQTVKGQPDPTEHGDLIFGFRHKDKLHGLDGDDALFGGVGRDKLYGGRGDDVLIGGRGDNTLKGGAGSDYFVFDWKLQPDRVSKIKDFKPGQDVLALDHDYFDLLAGGQLPEGMLRIGAKAKDADDRVIYNAKNGKLSFDVDGKGGQKAIHFAKMDKKLDLEASDILLV